MKGIPAQVPVVQYRGRIWGIFLHSLSIFDNILVTNLDALNEKQREAVVSESKRLLVLAGAGSGKTKTLLQKIIYLIEEKGVSPLEERFAYCPFCGAKRQ